MRNILISAEALSMTWADLSLLSSPFNSKWNPRAPISSIILHSLITGRLSRHYISKPSDHSPPSCKRLSAHCMRRYRDLKILISFLAMMNLIGDIWVARLVNDQLTKKTMDDDFIDQRKLWTGGWPTGWSNHHDSKRQNSFFWTDCFSTEQKDWVHATIRIVDTKTICHVSLIRW